MITVGRGRVNSFDAFSAEVPMTSLTIAAAR